jgi:hypothetical protein
MEISPEMHNSTAKWTILPRRQFLRPPPPRGIRRNAFLSNRYVYSSATTRPHWTKGKEFGSGFINSWREQGSTVLISCLDSNLTWSTGKWYTWPFAEFPECSKFGPANRLWTLPQPMEIDPGSAHSVRYAQVALKSTKHAHMSCSAITEVGLMP